MNDKTGAVLLMLVAVSIAAALAGLGAETIGRLGEVLGTISVH